MAELLRAKFIPGEHAITAFNNSEVFLSWEYPEIAFLDAEATIASIRGCDDWHICLIHKGAT